MLHRRPITQDKIDALYRAAEAADKDGDRAHAEALRKTARFRKRLMREQQAGVDSNVAAFMDAS